MDTAIELDFADGKYRFWLPMDRIVAIEEGERSILAIWSKLGAALDLNQNGIPYFVGGGTAQYHEIELVIRHGLVGGGLAPLDASRVIDAFVRNRPLVETLPVAWAILQAAIFGAKLKKKAEQTIKSRSRSRKASSSPIADNSASTGEPST